MIAIHRLSDGPRSSNFMEEMCAHALSVVLLLNFTFNVTFEQRSVPALHTYVPTLFVAL